MVLIKNMPFPKTCTECRYYYGYTCHVNGVLSGQKYPENRFPEAKRSDDCPLQEMDLVTEAAYQAGKDGPSSAT